MEKKDVFASRPVEDDTRILDTKRAEYEGISVLIEKWVWDGILGHSCIVPLQSLKEANMSNEYIIEILKDKLKIVGSTTEKETGDFLFLNFNFETE